ncbi:hypothetical protein METBISCDRAFT_15486 [Metschnikowia bicuspidata]|uniref:Calcipressin n=1 Tax=Metschnikowia bicuspidata TaxID=27322 RepID=A0A4P9ZCY4_9ASCO|nr:hypothetical protein METBISCDRAFT_15486 [Metschnikowia bicuspidata]
MPRKPTNSLILTHLDPDLLADPQAMVRVLKCHAVQSELVYLPRFLRYVVICPSAYASQQTKDFLQQKLQNRACVSYTLLENRLHMPYDDSWALSEAVDYLEIPLEEGSRRFLILPPLSPPCEWEGYKQLEDCPSMKTIYSADELANLLWDRLGGFNSTPVRHFETALLPVYDLARHKHFLFENLPLGVPAIVVDQADKRGSAPTTRLPKTSVPPRSAAPCSRDSD